MFQCWVCILINLSCAQQKSHKERGQSDASRACNDIEVGLVVVIVLVLVRAMSRRVSSLEGMSRTWAMQTLSLSLS